MTKEICKKCIYSEECQGKEMIGGDCVSGGPYWKDPSEINRIRDGKAA